MRMKKIILSAYTALYISISLQAQTDSTFVRTIYNADEDIYIVMNLIDKNITIPNQDFMGEMAGYIGDDKDFRKWLIIEAKFINVKTAQLSICNDEGTEDLEATLTINPDNTYTSKAMALHLEPPATANGTNFLIHLYLQPLVTRINKSLQNFRHREIPYCVYLSAPYITHKSLKRLLYLS